MSLGVFANERGDLAGAEAAQRELVERAHESLGEAHELTLTALGNLGLTLTMQRDLDSAETLGAEHRRVLTWIGHRGACLERLGRPAEAERELLRAYQGLHDQLGDGAKRTRNVLDDLVELYGAWGRPRRAERYRLLRDGQV